MKVISDYGKLSTRFGFIICIVFLFSWSQNPIKIPSMHEAIGSIKVTNAKVYLRILDFNQVVYTHLTR